MVVDMISVARLRRAVGLPVNLDVFDAIRGDGRVLGSVREVARDVSVPGAEGPPMVTSRRLPQVGVRPRVVSSRRPGV
jgi:hypothetical protein